jgi:hypothetical protein
MKLGERVICTLTGDKPPTSHLSYAKATSRSKAARKFPFIKTERFDELAMADLNPQKTAMPRASIPPYTDVMP